MLELIVRTIGYVHFSKARHEELQREGGAHAVVETTAQLTPTKKPQPNYGATSSKQDSVPMNACPESGIFAHPPGCPALPCVWLSTFWRKKD